MGKPEDGQPLPSTALDARGANPAAGTGNGCCTSCRKLREWVTFRCVFVLMLGTAGVLSAVFWLPIFHFGDQRDLDLDYRGHDIVASFMLRKSAPFLEGNILQLEGDIFDEMSFSSTKVEIISLEPSDQSNTTKVVFAVESDVTARSLIRALFVSLVRRESFLHVTTPLFGEPFSFEVLKFRGGITVSPPDQKAFLMQNDQILFNFTLNFSIDEILNNFNELRSQLKTGLHLAPYENLYIRLTNLKGSTVAPPTTVQSQVLLAVGIDSKSRLKQLAQTITGSHAKNLGLNNTVFGRVKQVSLSSILQHSLGGDGNSPSPSPSPSPTPLPQFHYHHHHHHHRHHHDTSLTPSISPSSSRGSHGSTSGRGAASSAPVPVPYPGRNKPAPPPDCPFRYRYRFPWNRNKHSHVAPSAPPGYAPDAAPPQPTRTNSQHHKRSPVPAASPRSVVHAHGHPPLKDKIHARPPDVMQIISPAPSPSSAGIGNPGAWLLLSFPFVIMLW